MPCAAARESEREQCLKVVNVNSLKVCFYLFCLFKEKFVKLNVECL